MRRVRPFQSRGWRHDPHPDKATRHTTTGCGHGRCRRFIVTRGMTLAGCASNKNSPRYMARSIPDIATQARRNAHIVQASPVYADDIYRSASAARISCPEVCQQFRHVPATAGFPSIGPHRCELAGCLRELAKIQLVAVHHRCNLTAIVEFIFEVKCHGLRQTHFHRRTY